MPSKRSGSLFDPPPEFASKELLYPTLPIYRRHSALGLVSGGGLIVLGLGLATILLFQMKSPSGKTYIDPILALSVFIAIAAAVRYLMVTFLAPVSVFYDQNSKKISFLLKGYLGLSSQELEASHIEHVELEKRLKGKNGDHSWIISVCLKDGSSHSLPPVELRVYAQQGAEKIAGRSKSKVVYKGVGGDGYGGEDEISGTPLYKRSNVSKPKPFHDELLLHKENISGGGVRYDVGLPLWVPMGILTFAMANLVLGVYIWMRMPKDIAVWASIPFLFTTFVVFVLAALVNTYKQQIELTISGISNRGFTVALHRLGEIRILVRSFVTRLQFVSRDEMFTIFLTSLQADALRADIEYEICKRRPQIEERLKGK